jgi:hypothetical protein
MSYRTSGEFRESKKMGSIGAGGGIGGLEGADLRRDRRGLSAEEAIEKFSIPEVEKDEGLLGLAKYIGINPLTTFSNVLTGNIPGMFANIVFGKGPYTAESIRTGDFADLTNAPADYKSAVQSVMGGEFSADQQAQIDAGDAAREAEQKATRGPEQMIAEVESVNPFADDPVKSIQYEDYLKGGYPPDMAEYLVNALS